MCQKRIYLLFSGWHWWHIDVWCFDDVWWIERDLKRPHKEIKIWDRLICILKCKSIFFFSTTCEFLSIVEIFRLNSVGHDLHIIQRRREVKKIGETQSFPNFMRCHLSSLAELLNNRLRRFCVDEPFLYAEKSNSVVSISDLHKGPCSFYCVH